MTRSIISKKDVKNVVEKLNKKSLKHLESEAWEDFLAMDVGVAGLWCATNTEPGKRIPDSRNEENVKLTDFEYLNKVLPDTYMNRLLKYIPAEVITLYLTLDAIIRSAHEFSLTIYWGIFAFGLAGTYLYLWRVLKVRKQTQLFISVMAYCVWVFALGGPFVHLQWYDSLYGGLLLPTYTFSVALYEAD